MTPRSLAWIAQAAGGELHGGDCMVDALATDTRALPQGKAALFVALKGEQFDGHDQVAAAANGGCVAALVARAIVQRNRGKAIAQAIGMAGADDVVLIAGKGHEPYQEILGVRHPFNDTDVARVLLRSRAQHMDVQVLHPQDAEKQPQHMDVQVLRPQDAEKQPQHMDVQVLRPQDAEKQP